MARQQRKAVYLNVRLQFREPDKALASLVKREASCNRRPLREQILFMLQFAADEMPDLKK